METHLRTQLILAALNVAITRRQPSAVIHHSDLGCQYTSYAFGKRCREAGVMPSMDSIQNILGLEYARFVCGRSQNKCLQHLQKQ
jgi:transposase InsO family protein